MSAHNLERNHKVLEVMVEINATMASLASVVSNFEHHAVKINQVVGVVMYKIKKKDTGKYQVLEPTECFKGSPKSFHFSLIQVPLSCHIGNSSGSTQSKLNF